MELRHLRYFVAVAEEMNFHRAAERLFISKPPLSLQIKQLEEEIGTKLFIREKKRIQLTNAGDLFLQRARDILRRADNAVLEAKGMAGGVTGKLTIDYVSSAIMGYLQNAVKKYRAQYPDVHIDLKQSYNAKILDDLLHERIDLGINRLPMDIPPTVQMHGLIEEPYCFALPENHPLAHKDKLCISNLKDDGLIIFPRYVAPAHYDAIINLYTVRGITPKIAIEVIDQDTIAALVASGLGIAIVPACMRTVSVPGVIHVDAKNMQRKSRMATLSTLNPSVQAQNFIACLDEAIQELA